MQGKPLDAAQTVSRLSMEPEILLIGGSYFNLLRPEESDFTIDDIAHGLSNVCRFAGHSRAFYSVAQHSVLVSTIVPPHLALAGLMHDASEAFLGDVTSPLKQLLPEYKTIEHRVEQAIFARFGVPYPLAAEVKHADLVALATEQRDLMVDHDRTRWTATAGFQPLSTRIAPISNSAAKRAFLKRYHTLTNER